MAIIDKKITNADYTSKDISSLSDKPSRDGMSATQLKERFDTIAKTVIAPKFNELIDDLVVDFNGKVDKVVGKVLSSNDYTDSEKNKLSGISAGAEVNVVDSVAGKTGDVVLNKSDVGLDNVDNTSDLGKPISTLQQEALNGKAPLVHNHDDRYYTEAEIDSQIYSKTEVDTFLADKSSILMADIPANTNLNTLIIPGIYTGLSNNGYTNLPPEHPAIRNFQIEVIPIFKNQNRMFFQIFREYNNPNIVYVRRIDNVTPANNTLWVNLTTPIDLSVTESKIANLAISTGKIKDKAITNAKLADNVLTKPNLASGVNLNTVILEGRYLGLNTSTHANLPSDFVGKSFFLDVKTYGTSGGFYLQEITEYNNTGNRKIRFIYPTGSVYGDWVNDGDGNPKFTGKTIVCFGDSVTEGSGFTYTPFMQKILSANVVNLGIGGTRLAKHMNTTVGNLYDEMGAYKIAIAIATNNFIAMENASNELKNNYSDDNTAIVAQIKNMNWSNVDYITFFYGQNDFAGDVPLGTNSDTTGNTFKGAFNIVVEQILTLYPHIKISFITPYFRSRIVAGDGLNSDDNPNSLSIFMIQYVDALKEMSDKHHCPILDLYRTGTINRYNSASFLTDGLHPNLTGQELIGKKISGFLDANF